MNRIVTILAALLLFHVFSQAQTIEKPDHDTTYYRSYKGVIIGRVYFSRSYTRLSMEPSAQVPKLDYHANTSLNIGFGLTYKSFSASFSKGLDFLKSDRTKGRTTSTNLQVHLYKRRWTIDALAQFYRGVYLNPRGLGMTDSRNYYIRPDMGMQLVGTSVYRVLNDRRFSYGAGLSQNAWQEKSAGSILLGGEAFYAALNADSALAPHATDSVYNSNNIHKVHLFEIGPGIGYAYTLVLSKHYFFLGSLNANINLRYSREIGNGIRGDMIGFSPNFILRIGTGYNTSKWNLSVSWITTSIRTEGKSSGYDYKVGTGNYRLVYARRFAINHKMKTIMGKDE